MGAGESRLLHAHARTHTHTLSHARTPIRASSSARTQGRPVSAGMKPRTEPSEEPAERDELERGKPCSRAPSSYGCRQVSPLWVSGQEQDGEGGCRASRQMLLTIRLKGGGSEGPEEVGKRAAAVVGQREIGSRRQTRKEAGRGWGSWEGQDTCEEASKQDRFPISVPRRRGRKEGKEGSGCPPSQGTALHHAHMVPLPKALPAENYHTGMLEPIFPAICSITSITSIQIPTVYGAPMPPLWRVQLHHVYGGRQGRFLPALSAG